MKLLSGIIPMLVASAWICSNPRPATAQSAVQLAAAQSRQVNDSRQARGALIAFHSPSCGPCRAMQPVLQSVAAQGFPIRYVDVTAETSLTRRYAISQTPTYVFMVAGKETTRLVGRQSESRLIQSLRDDGSGILRRTAASVRDRIETDDIGANQFGQTSPNQTSPDQSPRTRMVAPATDRGQTLAFKGAGGELTNEAMPSLSVADAVQRAKAATVRLRVHDGHGYGAGTGTIVDVHGEEALVLTCGHLFRETGDQGRIEVDVFVGGVAKTVEGTLIDFDAKHRDIAVVAIKPGVAIQPIAIAAATPVEVGTAAFSFGCDRGKDPSRRETRVTGVDKYNQHLGASNYEIDGAPIDGRSGGGLFDQSGRLIGVCNAADYDSDTGIYAGAGEIRWQLDRIGLARLYQSGANEAPIRTADATPQRNAIAATARNAVGSNSASFDAGNFNPASTTGRKELIVIVRDPDSGTDRVVTIDNPSRDLMAAVESGRTLR